MQNTNDKQNANARLIACALEMLAMLEYAFEEIQEFRTNQIEMGFDDDDNIPLKDLECGLRELIAKAKWQNQ